MKTGNAWSRSPFLNYRLINHKKRTNQLKFAEIRQLISPYKFLWKGETLWLSERRCIFWEEEKMLIISDPHFGKTGHFRKSGIYIPQQSFKADLYRLVELIQFFKPETVLINGDLFHSSLNKEILYFNRWREEINHIKLILIRGNHDRFKAGLYEDLRINVVENFLAIRSFIFIHDPDLTESFPAGNYIFAGHIHPGIRIHGAGKQSVTLPCFCFGKNIAILPAFGNFTGLANIYPQENDMIFGITEKEIILLN